jgi:hypothetical protein
MYALLFLGLARGLIVTSMQSYKKNGNSRWQIMFLLIQGRVCSLKRPEAAAFFQRKSQTGTAKEQGSFYASKD